VALNAAQGALASFAYVFGHADHAHADHAHGCAHRAEHSGEPDTSAQSLFEQTPSHDAGRPEEQTGSDQDGSDGSETPREAPEDMFVGGDNGDVEGGM
jgi:hypothetical protein